MMEKTCSLFFTVFGNRSLLLTMFGQISIVWELVRNAVLDPTPGPWHQKLHFSETLEGFTCTQDSEPQKILLCKPSDVPTGEKLSGESTSLDAVGFSPNV